MIVAGARRPLKTLSESQPQRIVPKMPAISKMKYDQLLPSMRHALAPVGDGGRQIGRRPVEHAVADEVDEGVGEGDEPQQFVIQYIFE